MDNTNTANAAVSIEDAEKERLTRLRNISERLVSYSELENSRRKHDSEILKDIDKDAHTVLFTKTKDGKLCRQIVCPDWDSECPREWDNLGTLIFKQRTLTGDESVPDVTDYMRENIEPEMKTRFYTTVTLPEGKDFHDYIAETAEFLKEQGAVTCEGQNVVPGIGQYGYSGNRLKVELICNGDVTENESFCEKMEELCSDVAKRFAEKYNLTFDENREADFYSFDNNEELDDEEIFNKFKETKAACLPVDYTQHGNSDNPHVYTASYYNSSTDGIIFVEKERAVEWGLYNEKLSPEENRNNLEERLKGEIATYNTWSQGDVCGVVNEIWNDESREWEHEDSCWGYYQDSSLSNYYDRCSGVIVDFGLAGDVISKEEAEELAKNSPEKFINIFFDNAKKLLPKFDNDPVHAFTSQLLLWQNNSNKDRAEYIENWIQATCKSSEYFNLLLLEKMDVPLTRDNFQHFADKIIPGEDMYDNGTTLFIGTSPLADKFMKLYEKSAKEHPELFAGDTQELFGTGSVNFHEVLGVAKHKCTENIISKGFSKNSPEKEKDEEIGR